VVKTSSTVLRWRQIDCGRNTTDYWELDGVRITLTAISKVVNIFSEHFDEATTFPELLSRWQIISGAFFATPDCGSIAAHGLSSTAAFFKGGNVRFITSLPLDLTNAQTLTFRIRLGGSGGCETVDVGEDVVVEYRPARMAEYLLLRRLPYTDYTAATQVIVALPESAASSSTILRWRQLNHSGYANDEWALDDITITMSATYILYEDFSSAPLILGPYWQNISGGTIQTPDCGSIDLVDFSRKAAFFSGSGERRIETNGLDLRSSNAISFRIRIGGGGGCGKAVIGEDVLLEYKPSGAATYTELKRMAFNQYATAQTVSVQIPPVAKTRNTVLRWKQTSHRGSGTAAWAIDQVLLTSSKISSATHVSTFSDNFDEAPLIPGSWWAKFSGGSVRTPDCGSIDVPGYSSQAAFFFLDADRYIQTQSLDLIDAKALSFRVQIGGLAASACEVADHGESVVVEYQADGSSKFTRLLLMKNIEYRTPRTVTIILPDDARKMDTVVRWRQLQQGGVLPNEWAIDHVSFLPEDKQTKTVTIFSEDFDVPPLFPGPKWQFISGGSITVPDCSSIDIVGYSSQAAFFSGSNSAISRYIETASLDLATATAVSFRLRIGGEGGCEKAESEEDVVLEYRTTGAEAFTRLELFSYYNYGVPQSVSVFLTVASKTSSTVLRWRQLKHSGGSYDEWAIDHIRIVGAGVTEDASSMFEEDFSPAPAFPGSKWMSIRGGVVKVPDCGGINLPGYPRQAAFFDQAGARSIETRHLDLRTTQSLSFVIQTGTVCNYGDEGEDIFVQYGTKGSRQYLPIATLRFKDYRTATKVTVPLPLSSRTEATSLRWLQTNDGRTDKRLNNVWSIDHIRIKTSAADRQRVVHFQLFHTSSTTEQPSKYDIRLEYSIDFGRTWSPAQTDCLPSHSRCTQTLLNSYYQPVLFTSWKRLTVILPVDAISNNTQIRWRQPSTAKGNEWGIDDVYYGETSDSCVLHGPTSPYMA
jgi:reelin